MTVRPLCPSSPHLMQSSCGRSAWALRHGVASAGSSSILHEGYSLEFLQLPPLSVEPIITSSADPGKQVALQGAFQDMVDKGALEVVSNPTTPEFYSRVFLVPKKLGGWQPVIDLKVLNTFLVHKMELAESIRVALLPGLWTFSIDLTDAYFHMPIHPRSRKFLRLMFEGRVHQFCALPFGLSLAPWLFTMISREFQSMLRRRGIAMHQFMDNWLGKASSPHLCAAIAT